MVLTPRGGSLDRASIVASLPGAQNRPVFSGPSQFLKNQSAPLVLPAKRAAPTGDGGPGGVFGLALNVLDFGRAGIVSGVKETIDLLQDIKRGEVGSGEFSPSEWWNQATSHYGFGDLIHDEREAVGYGLIAMSPFTAGFSGALGAGVLADNIWADRIIGFIGDVAVDPLTYLGGYNAVIRGFRATKYIQHVDDFAALGTAGVKALAKDAGKSISDDVATKMVKAAEEAIEAGGKSKSLSSMSRSLRQTDEGKLVAELMGLDPGLRIRMPGTGPLGRVMRQDRYLEKLGIDIAGHQVRSIPRYFKRGHSDEAWDAAVRAFRPSGDAAARAAVPKSMREAAGLAARAPVEFVFPSAIKGAARGGLAASLIARATDLPIRGAQRVDNMTGQRLSVMFDPDSYLKPMMESGDHSKVAIASRVKDFMRHGRAKESFFTRSIDTAMEAATRRGVTSKVSDESMLDLMEYAQALARDGDGMYDNIFTNEGQVNRSGVWFDNLPADVKNLSPEEFFVLARDLDRWVQTASQHTSDAYGTVWDATVKQLALEEGGAWRAPRRLTVNARRRFSWGVKPDASGVSRDINPDYYDAATKMGGRSENLHYEASGRFEPASTKKRLYKIGSTVSLDDVDGAADGSIRLVPKPKGQGPGFDAKLVDPATGEVFKVVDPNTVGKSIRRQIDEVYEAAFGERMFEDKFSTLADAWKRGMARDLRVEHFMNRLRDVFPTERLDDVIVQIEESFEKFTTASKRRDVANQLRDKLIRQRDNASAAAAKAATQAQDKSVAVVAKELKANEILATIRSLDGQMLDMRAEMAEIEAFLGDVGLKLDDLTPTSEKATGLKARYGAEAQEKIVSADAAAARVAEIQNAMDAMLQLRRQLESFIREEIGDSAAPLIADMEAARVSYGAALDEHRELSVAANEYEAKVSALIVEIGDRAPQISAAVDDARRLLDLADVEDVAAAQVKAVPASEVDARAEVVGAVAALEEAEFSLRNAETNVRILGEAVASLEGEAVAAARRLSRSKLGATVRGEAKKAGEEFADKAAREAYDRLLAVEAAAAKKLREAKAEAERVIAKATAESARSESFKSAVKEYDAVVAERMKVYERPKPRFEGVDRPRDPNEFAVPEGLRAFDDGAATAEKEARLDAVARSAKTRMERLGAEAEAAFDAEFAAEGVDRGVVLSEIAGINRDIRRVEEMILAEEIRFSSATRSKLAETRSLAKRQRWVEDIGVMKSARDEIKVPPKSADEALVAHLQAQGTYDDAVRELKKLRKDPAFNLRKAVVDQLRKEGVVRPEPKYSHNQWQAVRARRLKVERAQAAFDATQSHQLRGDKERLGDFFAAHAAWSDIVEAPPARVYTRTDGSKFSFGSKSGDRSRLAQAQVREALAAEAVDARTAALRTERALSAAKGRVVKIVGKSHPLMSSTADLFAQSANDGPYGVVRVKMKAQQIVPSDISGGFARPGGERTVYLRVRRVREGEWQFTSLNQDLQGSALEEGMQRGGDVRRSLVEAGWRMFDETAPLGQADRPARLVAVEQRVLQLKQRVASSDASFDQLSVDAKKLREAEKELEALADELLTPAERASKARKAAQKGARTVETLEESQAAAKRALEALQAEPQRAPDPWHEIMFPERQALLDGYEEHMKALSEQIAFIRENILPVLAAKGKMLAGDDITVTAMRSLLNRVNKTFPQGNVPKMPDARMEKWIELVETFENVNRLLQHERFVAAGRIVDDDGTVRGMAALRRAEQELNEFNATFEAAAKEAGVPTVRTETGETGYQVAETFLSGKELTDLRERVNLGIRLKEQYEVAVRKQTKNVEAVARATAAGNEFEAKRLEKLLRATELETELAALEAGEWSRSFHDMLTATRGIMDTEDKVSSLLKSLEARAQRVGTRVKPVRVKGQIVEPGAQIGRHGQRKELTDTFKSAMETTGYSADTPTGANLFELHARERAQAQHLLKSALSNSEWGPWRLISADETLNSDVAAVINAYARINDPKEWGLFWTKWDKFQTWLKAGMIATPGFVNRNVFGAFFNAWLDGVNLNEIARSVRMTLKASNKALKDQTSVLVAAEALAKNNPEFNDYVELLRLGVRGGGQAVDAVELEYGLRNARSLEMLVGGRKTVGGKQTGVSFNPTSPRFVAFQSVRTVNSWVEDIVRIGVGMDTLRYGGSTDAALERIAKSQFDYDELTSWERDWAKRFIPFYTWTRKNVPYQLKQLAAHPEKYNRLLSAKRNLELGTEEEHVVPDYYLEPFGIRLPFSFRGAQVYSAPDLPFQDLARYGGKKGVKGALQTVASGVTPIIKTPLEAAFGKQIFTGIPFTGRYQQAPAPIASIPGVMEALGAANMAKKNRRGEWRMRDHDIYVVMGLLPTIGLIRRMFPNEEKYQRNQIRTLLSTLGGVSVQFNTPETQSNWLRNQKYEVLDDRQDRKDLEMRTK